MWLELDGIRYMPIMGISGYLLLVLSLTALRAVKVYGTSIRLLRDCHNESDRCWK